jgi:hypothetical protein
LVICVVIRANRGWKPLLRTGGRDQHLAMIESRLEAAPTGGCGPGGWVRLYVFCESAVFMRTAMAQMSMQPFSRAMK